MIYVFTYLSDQLLNLFIGFGAVGLTTTIVLTWLRNVALPDGIHRFELIRNYYAFAFLAALSLWSVSAAFLSSCGLQYKGFLSLILLWLVFFSRRILSIPSIALNYRISNLILIIGGLSIVAQYMGVGILSTFWDFNKPAGFFTEPSHASMYLLPLIVFRLLRNCKDLIALICIGVIALFSSSASFIVGLVLLSLVIYSRIFILSPRRLLTSLFGFGLILAVASLDYLGLLDFSLISDRVNAILLAASRQDPTGIMNASAIVWLNGWSQAYETFAITNGLGVGWNQMGCGDFYDVGRFSNHIRLWTATIILNWNDGSFMASKLIVELGIFGILIVLWLCYISIRSIYKHASSSDLDELYKAQLCANAAGAIGMLSLLFVRANGYYLMPVILLLALLLFRAHPSSSAIKK
jgi:hypothetical protein